METGHETKLLLSILGLVTVSSFGQGAIILDNYNTYGPYVTYGYGSDGTVGTGLLGNYTMGLYYWNAPGDFTSSVVSDPTTMAIPSSLNANLILATGPGSTAQFARAGAAILTPGTALAGATFNVPGSSTAGGQVWTFMIIAYEGASYASALYRAHSAAFILTTSADSSPAPVATGTAMPAFSIYIIPEPSAFALVCLGCGAVWLCIRPRRS